SVLAAENKDALGGIDDAIDRTPVVTGQAVAGSAVRRILGDDHAEAGRQTTRKVYEAAAPEALAGLQYPVSEIRRSVAPAVRMLEYVRYAGGFQRIPLLPARRDGFLASAVDRLHGVAEHPQT